MHENLVYYPGSEHAGQDDMHQFLVSQRSSIGSQVSRLLERLKELFPKEFNIKRIMDSDILEDLFEDLKNAVGDGMMFTPGMFEFLWFSSTPDTGAEFGLLEFNYQPHPKLHGWTGIELDFDEELVPESELLPFWMCVNPKDRQFGHIIMEAKGRKHVADCFEMFLESYVDMMTAFKQAQIHKQDLASVVMNFYHQYI